MKTIIRPFLRKSILFQIITVYLLPTVILISAAIYVNSNTARQQAVRNSEEVSEFFISMVKEQISKERDNIKGAFHILTNYLLTIDESDPHAVAEMERIVKKTLTSIPDAFAIWVAYEADSLVPGEIFFSCYIKMNDDITVIRLTTEEDINAFYAMNVHNIPFTKGVVWTEVADYWDYGLDITGRYFDAIGGPLIRDDDIIGVVGLDIIYDAFLGFISDWSIESERTVLLINENGEIIYSPDGYACPLLGQSITNFISAENSDIVLASITDGVNFSIKGELSFFEPQTLMHFGKIPTESPYVSQSLYVITALNENVVYRDTRATVQGFILVAIFGTLTVVIFLFFTIGAILRPINNLTHSANLIADGNLDVELAESLGLMEGKTTKNEVYLMESALKKMLSQLSQMQTIKDLRELAEQSNKAKGIFLANMSHEIRTPMNVILGISEIQLRNENLSSDVLDDFEKICDSGTLLLNIINDILDFSKIEAGKMELTYEIYDIPSLINDTIQINRMRYESSIVNFILKVDENTPLELIGDEFRLRQILNNLLSNAFKYTDEGEVILSVYAEEYPLDENTVNLVFKVSDTGYGMTEDQVEKLYDEYSRFNSQSNRSVEGTGLGMSITKRLIDLMDGQIDVESKPGIGSTFIIRVPQEKVGNTVCGSDLSERLQSFRFRSMSISKRARILYEHMPYGKVLIVDDIESNLYVAKCMLTPYKIQTETAQSGFEAIDMIKEGNSYDIIFMDHMMPGMNGIEALNRIRDMGYTNPIVALTANAVSGQQEMFMKCGFDGFISKPIDSRELNHYLIEYVRNAHPFEVSKEARKIQAEQVKDEKPDELSNDMIHFFIRDATKTINVINDTIETLNMFKYVKDDEMEVFVISTHGMKSALFNIKEVALADMALELEQAGRVRDFDTITAVAPIFSASLSSLVLKYAPEQEKEKDIFLNHESKLLLKQKFYEIKEASTVFNKSAIKSALREIHPMILPSEIRENLTEMETHVLHSAFEKINILAEELINQLIEES